MKCPYCGNKTNKVFCEYCKEEIPYNGKMFMFKRFISNLLFNIDRFIFPPAKFLCVLWTIGWISDIPKDIPTPLGQRILEIIIGYLVQIIVADLLYMMKKGRYLLYKVKILKRKADRLNKLMDKYIVELDDEDEKDGKIDFYKMDGYEFEHFCANILSKNGFENVEVTQSSGDHGIDILAEKYGISYAIQCKCYSSNIGNAAVQQAHTGKSLYNKDIAAVLTNQYFTQQAIEEASILGVKLWDRDKLQEMIDNAS